jgi:hypothetical protein
MVSGAKKEKVVVKKRGHAPPDASFHLVRLCSAAGLEEFAWQGKSNTAQ